MAPGILLINYKIVRDLMLGIAIERHCVVFDWHPSYMNARLELFISFNAGLSDKDQKISP